MDLYSQALQPLVNTVAGLNAYWSTNPRDLTPFGCQQAKKKWFLEAGRNANQGVNQSSIPFSQYLPQSLTAWTLLKYHGMGPFYVKLKEFQDKIATKDQIQVQEANLGERRL